MNEEPKTLADKLNNATSFRGAALAIVIAVLTTAQGGKLIDRVWPDKSIAQEQQAQNTALILKELETIRWCLMRQFGITTNGPTQ